MPDQGQELRKRAAAAREKAASLGPNVDLESYTTEGQKRPPLSDVRDLPGSDREQIRQVGIKDEIEERSGTFIQIDDSVVYSEAREEGLEIMGMAQALEKHDWLRDYWWNAVQVDTDKYTAAVELDFGGGYFIRAKKGYRSRMPVQSCLYLSTDSLAQRVHNVVMVEEGAELHVITGCANNRGINKALHMGVSELYIKEGGTLSFTMIHNWKRDLAVRPRSSAIVERGGVLVSDYICLEPAGSLQMYPTAYLRGPEAVARFYSLLLASPGSELDVGGRVWLQGEGSRAEILSRAVTTGGKVIARGDMIGAAPKVKGHLECDGLILSDEGLIHAVPELRGELADVDLSHEAAVGKVSQEEIEYLMARGLSASEATATIVRGFLDVKIEGLPDELSSYIQQVVQQSEQQMSM
jgi:Fe-S cluster assembly scaffold protein SufB